ncbi:MAG: TIM44-like domain-containing protein, partial [Candidatus Puniceispirillaceae bacterium]
NKEGEQLTITVHAINDVQLTDGSVKDSIAAVTVTFVSEQSRTVKNNAGHIVEDESEERAVITDIWVFERDTQLDDPNWKLVETQNEVDS